MAKKKLYDENGNVVRGKIKKPFYKKVWFWIVVVLLVFIFGNLGSSDDSASEADNNAKVEEKTAEEPKKTEVTKDESSEAKAEKEETKKEDDVPTEYKSALNKANSYAKNMYMSKAAVYDQLTSEYGEKFSQEAADYAMDNVEADWKANALKKAKSYQEEMDMSPESVRDQLSSEHGEQFTQEEADYAVENLDK